MKDYRIQILPEDLAKQIAAGEVIERPASVVKELVENAVDAEATFIVIEVFEGGRKRIRITDNGTGMKREDAILSVERHSTSKIKTKEELANIETLGFRGEALPSIASVSKMKITTLFRGENIGTELCLMNGKIKEVKDVGSAAGTAVEVNDLFYNTPARLKFLKSVNTELSYINTIINQEALGHPNIHFKLLHNNRLLQNIPPLRDDLDRLTILFGKERVKDLIKVKANYNSLELRGYISSPSISRTSRGYQYLFVNSRPIKDRMMTHAVYEAYKTFITKDRNPVFFLFLNVRPDTIDVNVHPSKMEVRFRNQHEVHDFIREMIRNYLLKGKPTQRESVSSSEEGMGRVEFLDDGLGKPLDDYKGKISEMILKSSSSVMKDFSSLKLKSFDSRLLFKPESIGERLRVLKQVDNSFLLFDIPEGILFVDQHVAHERILFEKLSKDYKESHVEVQHLLFRKEIEFTQRETSLLVKYAEKLSSIGFLIEHLRENTFSLRGVPTLLSEKDSEGVLHDILDRLTGIDRVKPFEEMVEDILVSIACHGALKDNNPLEEEEMVKLMEDLMKTDIPHTCPHGRPIMLVLAIDDIKKKFQMK